MAEEEKPPLDNKSSPQQIAAFRKTVIPKLAELGVRKLIINYSGSGDDGSVEGFDVEPQGLAIPEELEKQICDLADEFL